MTAGVAGVLVAAAALVAALPWAVPHRLRGPAGPRRDGVARGRPVGVARALRRPHATSDVLDPAFVLDLCAAAVRGGAPVPVALVVTGRHLGRDEGDALVRAGTALALGAPWDVAWAGSPPSVATLARALRTGWDSGSSPAVALRAAAAGLRRERRARVRTAAGALGVRLTLPLGVCFLPAFVLLGLVPVVLGLAGDLRGVLP
ncbi:type II secretion system F family protein [Cellulomonas phragmiteti]|uniref:Type II secretion system protein GspF domain-containing protein n=1 Tax=Cellulomonas phragmiteti TaxID=478780 RepID=A0ABQ4DME2_9CELL|nr:type II secretion system F family protein [Cellulomonas phragmiteti]GIG40514.1 hypothetical protein Cph01nite_22760 [Cellulomonas phragmiteti]